MKWHQASFLLARATVHSRRNKHDVQVRNNAFDRHRGWHAGGLAGAAGCSVRASERQRARHGMQRSRERSPGRQAASRPESEHRSIRHRGRPCRDRSFRLRARLGNVVERHPPSRAKCSHKPLHFAAISSGIRTNNDHRDRADGEARGEDNDGPAQRRADSGRSTWARSPQVAPPRSSSRWRLLAPTRSRSGSA